MSALNAVLRGVLDALLAPVGSWPPLGVLTALAIATAVVLLLVFKVTSQQRALEAVKRQIHAGLFEIRLFNDDLRAVLRAVGGILRHNLTYLRLSLVPMLFVLPPLVVVVAHLQFFFGYAPAGASERLLLEIALVEGWEADERVPRSEASGKPRLELELPDGLRRETPSVWIPAQRTLSWRLAVERPGAHVVGVRVGERRYEKAIDASPGLVRRSPVRPARSFLDQLVYPAEPPLPADGTLERVSAGLPAAEIGILGWTLRETAGIPAWMILYFVLAVAFALALRRPLGVVA